MAAGTYRGLIGLTNLLHIRGHRGASAMEFVLLAPVLMTILLSVFDLGMAGAGYIQSYQTVRRAAAYVQYNPPPTVTGTALADYDTVVSTNFPGVNVTHLRCNYVDCITANAANPIKTVVLTNTFDVKAVVLRFLAGSKSVDYESRYQ